MAFPRPRTPAQKAQQLLDRVSEYRADFDDILTQLEELRQECMNGIQQEKVAAKLDVPMEVVEKYPQVALQAILGKHTVLSTLIKLASTNAGEQVADLTIKIVRAVPEDNLDG